MPDFLRTEVIAVCVARALSGDDTNANAQRNPLGRALHDRFVDADRTGRKVFKVKVGIIAAAPERFGEVCFQIPLRNTEFRGEK